MDYYGAWLHASEVAEQLRQENEELRQANQRLEEQFYDACMSCTELEQRLYWLRKSKEQSHKHRTEIMATNKYGKEIITKERAAHDLAELLGCLPFEQRVSGRNFYSGKPDKDGIYTLFIDKRQTNYHEARRIAVEYFDDKVLEEGGCKVENCLVLFTLISIGVPVN